MQTPHSIDRVRFKDCFMAAPPALKSALPPELPSNLSSGLQSGSQSGLRSGWRRWLRKIRKSYTVRVVTQGLITIWVVTTLTFFLIRLMPGNPLDIKIDQLQRTQGLNY